VAINKGTSYRDYLNPHGHPEYPSVALANCLVARLGLENKLTSVHLDGNFPITFFLGASGPGRCMLIALITISLGGHMVLENPGSSLIWMHDKFQWFLGALESVGLKEAQSMLGTF